MAHFFTAVPETVALLRVKGVFSEAPVFQRNSTEELFVKVGSAFLRLIGHGGTSRSGTFWSAIAGSDIVERAGAVYMTPRMIAVAA